MDKELNKNEKVDFEMRPLFKQTNKEGNPQKTIDAEKTDEQKEIDAETIIAYNFLWAYIILMALSIICLLVGINMRHGELFIAIGASCAIFNSIWYFLVRPIIFILVGISRNLRELNNKTK